MNNLLILGIGNVLLRDEGIGVRVVEALTGEDGGLPPGTRVVDGGTLGLDLLPLFEEVDGVVLVDAVDFGAAPGRVQTLRDQELETVISQHLSPHQIGTADLLSVARLVGTLPPRAALVGVQPGVVEVGLELSEPVQRALRFAVQAVRTEAWTLSQV